MKHVLESILRFFCVVIGLILLSAFVGLFTKGIQLDIGLYMESIIQIVQSLIRPQSLVFIGPTGFEYSIFINFWDNYFYSMVLFLTALLISVVIGIFIAYLTTLLPQKNNQFIVKTVSLLESLPDLLIIIVLQLSAIFYYKQTGTLLFSTASTSQNKSYFLPIITLALIPAVMVFKVILYLVNEEMKKTYVDLAKSKGFNRSHIFFSHVLRNIAPNIIIHSKSIIIILLSSMVVVEKLFNINGIFSYIIAYPNPDIIAFTLILIYVPIFIIYTFITKIIYKQTGQRLEW
ncbi:ABC transporter permease subunit [Psychrobacillus sp. FSL H8-0484]|uniref:ABC transporter permease subunit n=1 Tax=Psychrobacillus sp. FSL H8-0484 TaxID=2921390 RepID=UPI0030F8D65E